MNINSVWNNIIKYEGQKFYTKRGIECTYIIKGEQIVLQNTNRNIPRSNIEKAIAVDNPSVYKFEKLNLQGPSYIYAIITDERICK